MEQNYGSQIKTHSELSADYTALTSKTLYGTSAQSLRIAIDNELRRRAQQAAWERDSQGLVDEIRAIRPQWNESMLLNAAKNEGLVAMREMLRTLKAVDELDYIYAR